jgi:hypothetical protein
MLADGGQDCHSRCGPLAYNSLSQLVTSRHCMYPGVPIHQYITVACEGWQRTGEYRTSHDQQGEHAEGSMV